MDAMKDKDQRSSNLFSWNFFCMDNENLVWGYRQHSNGLTSTFFFVCVCVLGGGEGCLFWGFFLFFFSYFKKVESIMLQNLEAEDFTLT